MVEGNGVHAILDHRAHAHEPHAMRDESPLVPQRRVRQPDGGEPAMLEEVQEVRGARAAARDLLPPPGPARAGCDTADPKGRSSGEAGQD